MFAKTPVEYSDKLTSDQQKLKDQQQNKQNHSSEVKSGKRGRKAGHNNFAEILPKLNTEQISKIIIEMQAIAQNGLAYCQNDFDRIRYQRFLEISAYLASNLSRLDYQNILSLFSHDIGYVTPKIDVRGAIFQDDKILMVKEKQDNLWSLPGGWADINLSPSVNIIKEIKEETGYDAKIVKLIGIYDKNKPALKTKWPHVYKIFFLCRITGGSYVQNNEIIETGFFKIDKIPPLSKGRITKKQIKQCFIHYHNPDLPAGFD